MKLDEEKDTVNSIVGSCFSLVLFLIVVLYAYQKTEVWANNKANTITQSIFQN